MKNAVKRNYLLAGIIVCLLVVLAGCGEGASTAKFDIADYTGTYWATEGITADTGGYVLSIYTDEVPDTATIALGLYQANPGGRIAIAFMEKPLAEIKDNEINLSFNEDGWGHSGNVKLVFEEDGVSFSISNVKYMDTEYPEDWGFFENSGYLVNNPDAYEALAAADDYEDNYEVYTYYDTSKASGILASLGMTEDEFKASCYALNMGAISPKTTAYYVDYEDLLHYPNEYIDQHFVICNNVYDYFVCQSCNGKGDSCAYYNGDIDKYDENGQHLDYRADYERFKPEVYSMNIAGTSGDGYQCYTLYESSAYKPTLYIFDMRDDIYSPNIAAGGVVTPYMIFTGLGDNGTALKFQMICCDVTF